MSRFVVVGAALSMALLACSASATQDATDPEPAIPHAPSGFLKIQTRDRSITLFTADHGVRRATVQDGQGRVLFERVDVEQLPALDARVYDVVRSTFAGDGVRSDLRGDL